MLLFCNEMITNRSATERRYDKNRNRLQVKPLWWNNDIYSHREDLVTIFIISMPFNCSSLFEHERVHVVHSIRSNICVFQYFLKYNEKERYSRSERQMSDEFSQSIKCSCRSSGMTSISIIYDIILFFPSHQSVENENRINNSSNFFYSPMNSLLLSIEMSRMIIIFRREVIFIRKIFSSIECN